MSGRRLLLPALAVLLLLGVLAACGGGGGGGGGGAPRPPGGGAPEYVEAGLVVYDSIHLNVGALAMPLARELQEAAADLETQSLPIGHKALLKVYWQSVPQAEGYRVYLREAGGAAEEIASLGASGTEFTLRDVLPVFDLQDGVTYEAGVAAVKNGRAGNITWSWSLRVLGAVHLTAPLHDSGQPRRPSFVWSNARGNPSAVEITVVDAAETPVLSDFWTGAPLPSNASANMDLADGRYRWQVVNGGSSQPIQDPRMLRYFPSGHTVLSLPAPLAFRVGAGGGTPGGDPGDGGPGDGGGGTPGGGSGSYNIELRFGPSISEGHKDIFRAAARRWEQVITGDLPDTPIEKPHDLCGENDPAENGMVDDIIIFAEVDDIDGPGKILAYAGPCLIRTDNGLSLYGIMRFDAADMPYMEQSGGLADTIIHEMGHVLGVGTLWDSYAFGLLEYPGDDCFAASTVSFTGPLATAEWRALGGSGSVPVENDYGPGTKCGHWDQQTFDTEMMTGFDNGPGIAAQLSRVTAASLADLGYEVNMAAADAYQLPACSPNCAGPMGTSSAEADAHSVLITPSFGVEPDGTLIELPAKP